MAVPGGVEAGNPGDTMAVTVDKSITNEEGTVEAVTVEDIMEGIPAPSYIIKTDIQKYDCKVLIYRSPCSPNVLIQNHNFMTLNSHDFC